MPMYMSEKNVGDMSVICRKEKWLKTNMLSFYGKLVADNKCRRHQERRKDLAVMKVIGIIRNEGSDKTGVGVISISDH